VSSKKKNLSYDIRFINKLLRPSSIALTFPPLMFFRIFNLSTLLSLAYFLVSCGHSTPDFNPALGPFDENGNYIEAWADNPPKRGILGRNKPRPTEQAPIASKPQPTSTSTAPTPRPKPAAPKPRYKYHKIAKGDTLWGLSRKYGVSVSSLQRTNGISGSNIRIGRTLKIPIK